jgi:ABC-type antimicrobial peptide transport system permease subunit
LEEAREALIAPERFVMQLAVFFGLVSMVVASIGTFGVLWYSMTRRSAEIGIRMALGAQRGAVIGMFMKEAGWVVGAGVISGLLAALAGTRLITSMLFGVTPVDAASFGMAALILVTASLLAAWLPARHASRVDPLVALGREE